MSRSDADPGPKLLFLTTEDWYFCSHRLPVARAARDAGYAVVVATRVDRHGEAIRREGLGLRPLNWRRGSRNPWREFMALLEVWRLYRRERPDIVHHIAMKPILLGTLAARMAGVRTIIDGVMGLGYSFTVVSEGKRFSRAAALALLRLLLRHRSVWLVFQNRDDREVLVRGAGIDPGHGVLIRGSGVDAERFTITDPPSGSDLTVAIAARMIAMKGVDTVVSACRLLRRRRPTVRLFLVGEPDDANPTSFDSAQLEAWGGEAGNEWLGRVDDVAPLWRRAHIAALAPRGGEGVPMSLIEAAACGRPIVATDVPGCREIVADGKNGFLVPPNDPEAFAEALERLIRDPEMRRRFGAAGREMVEREFTQESVVRDTLALYRRARTP